MKTDLFLTLTIFFLTKSDYGFFDQSSQSQSNQISNSKNCLGFVSCINGKLPVEGSIGTIIYFKAPFFY